jgi:diguanylate cyclase (GGDEF)-like protein
MERELNDNVKKWYFLGFTKNQVQSVIPILKKGNISTLKNLSISTAICFFVLSIFPILLQHNILETIADLVAGFVSILFYFASKILLKHEVFNKKTLSANIIYLSHLALYLLLIIGYSIYAGVYHNRIHPAVIFFLVMLTTQFLFTINLIGNFFISLICYSVFIALAIHYKPREIWIFDISSCLITFLLSNITWYETVRNRITQSLEELRLTEANIALYDLANKDSLTMLYNRRKFYEEMQKLLIARDLSKGTIAVLIIDIDDFSSYNETYSHENGDKALVLISQEFIKCAVRHDIVICRWGGEEFMAIVPVKTSEEAQEIAEEIRASIENLHLVNRTLQGKKQLYLTVSIGLHILSGRHTETWEEMYHNTYDLLSHAKQSGKNRIEFSIN